jgi:NAD(P)H-nitrite reductase large subunit
MDNQEHNTDLEEQEIMIDDSDVDAIINFSKFFEAPMTEALKNAVDIFKKDKTMINQKKIKLEVSKWILSTKSDVFIDEVWDSPKKTMDEIIYNLSFDQDLNELLTEPNKKE